MTVYNMKILKEKYITITDDRPDFDRACSEANIFAILQFDIDDCGHSSSIEGWERSTCYIKVEFEKYYSIGDMVGFRHFYNFKAYAIKQDEDE